MSRLPSWTMSASPSSSSNVLVTGRRRSGSFYCPSTSTTDVSRGRPMSRLPFSRSRIHTPSSPPENSSFDPFGSDVDSALTTNPSPPALLTMSTNYTHYYQYNPRSKLPTVLYKQENWSSPSLSSSSSPSSYSPPPAPLLKPRSLPTSSRVQPASVNVTSTSTTSLPLHTVPIPAKDTRAKLVAGILLNRIHVVGKPLRHGRCAEQRREYVKSCLSRVVCVE